MTKIWLKKLAIVAVAIGVITAGSPATPASASSCYTPWCGGVMTNNSSGYFWVTNCWGSGTEWYGNFPPCATGGWNAYAANSYFWLAPTDTTANYYWYYDTDAFRIDAGCRMTTWSGSTVVYDNRGSSSHKWIKINNLSKITVQVACW